MPISSVEDGASLLLSRLSLLMVPALVGSADSWTALRAHIPELLATVGISTAAVLLGSALVVEQLARRFGHADH